MTVLLPGEPVSHAHANAAAHLSTIVAAHDLEGLSRNVTIIDAQLDLTIDMVSLIGDLSWNAGDGNDALRDAIEQYLQEMPLSVEQFARKSHWSEDWQLTHYQGTLTWGGPACRFWFDPSDGEVRMEHQDWGQALERAALDQDEIHALQWFASGVPPPRSAEQPEITASRLALQNSPAERWGFFMRRTAHRWSVHDDRIVHWLCQERGQPKETENYRC